MLAHFNIYVFQLLCIYTASIVCLLTYLLLESSILDRSSASSVTAAQLSRLFTRHVSSRF
jgi:hypothetical protein